MAAACSISTESAREDTWLFLNSIKAHIDDEQFQRMDVFLNATGRGRKVKLVPQLLTNKLLYQLEFLRRKCGISWAHTENLFGQVVNGDPLQSFLLKNEIEGALKEGKKLDATGLVTFLSVNVEDSISCRNIGPHLFKHGIRRQHLKNPDLLKDVTPPAHLTNGLVVDVAMFHGKDDKSPNILKLLTSLGADISGLSNQQMYKKVRSIMSRYHSLRRSLHRPTGAPNMEKFLAEVPFGKENDVPVKCVPCPTPDNLAVLSAQRTAASLRRHLESQDVQLEQMKEENVIIKGIAEEKLILLKTAKEQTAKSEDVIAEKDRMIKKLKNECQNAKDTIKKIRRSAFYIRLQRKENYLKTKEAIIDAHQRGRCHQTAQDLRKKIKNLQTECSRLRRHVEKKNVDVGRLNQTLNDLLDQQPSQLQNIDLTDKVPVVRLKDERGYFKKDAIICVMQLVGENEVPPGRCGAVIKSVINQLLNAEVPDTDLPSMRSAERFIDRAHVISKIHVAETLLESDNWDLHTDGTSKCGKKFISQQVNIPGKALTTGFTPVSTENATTLVDITINLLQELSEVFSEGESHEIFLQLLRGMSALMSDRAAVMKAFGRAINDERRQMLQTDDDLHLLYCNAHFLLGMSAACEKVLKQTEKDAGFPLGRDQLAKFQSFKNSPESSASRYIRLACDCFGPRGDEKSGCQDMWETFCQMTGKKSSITSFRSNRFNNFFEAAAALHFHRDDVSNCLQSLPKLNNKLESVLADNRSDEIDQYLIAVGIIFYRITGPYWELLGRDVHYLDFSSHVVKMHNLMLQWSEDPHDAFEDDFDPLFGVEFNPNPGILRALLDASQDTKEAVKILLRSIMVGCLETSARQLADFLRGGKYHDVQDPELRQRLQHSKLTNMIGEAVFGDLDFSLFKRRSASLHHHSTINMLKRNKTITTYFNMKTPEEQHHLLQLSGRKAEPLRKKHRQEERDAVARRQVILDECRAKKGRAEEMKRTKILDATLRLRPHGGPCATLADVDRLLTTYVAPKERFLAVKAELSFRKLVLLEKSPLLKVTGTIGQLVQRLKQTLGADEITSSALLPPLPVPVQAQATRCRQPAKRPRLEYDDTTDTEFETEAGETDSTVSDSEESDDDTPASVTQFTFQTVGQFVAVYFLEDFYIGKVTSVVSPEEGIVNFMENATFPIHGRSVFRWPRRKDECPISSEFVFEHDIVLTPSSTSGRAFVVVQPKALKLKYRQFKATLAAL